jgi:SAM-dependent methyltransferase
VGLSDWPVLADALARVYPYRNTFFDEEPQLDISNLPAEFIRGADFLISSDVFEHVAPPVQRAFDGAFSMLRPGGLLILTVPYIPAGRTVEHYPRLDDFAVVQLRTGHVLVNRTRDGILEVFDDLVFHGGPGSTLEMRIFGLQDILVALDAAGFIDVVIAPDDPEHGVIWHDDFSRTLVARVPVRRRLWRRARRAG